MTQQQETVIKVLSGWIEDGLISHEEYIATLDEMFVDKTFDYEAFYANYIDEEN